MLGLNTVFLVGEVGRLSGLSATTKGTSMFKFTVDIKRPMFNKPGEYYTSKINVVVWGKRAEEATLKTIAVGSPVAVRGELRIQNTKKEQDGVTFWHTDVSVNADEVAVLLADSPNASQSAEAPYDPYPSFEDANAKQD